MTFRALGRNIAITDLTPISTMRILTEAMGEEFARLWEALAIAQDESLNPVGAELDRRIDPTLAVRPAAERATGVITMTATADGCTVRTSDTLTTNPTDGSTPIQFGVTKNPDSADGTWTISASSTRDDILIEAKDAGAQGNVPAGSITRVAGTIAGLALDANGNPRMTNPLPLIDGRNVGSDDEFKAVRDAAYAALPGLNRFAVEQAILALKFDGRRVVKSVQREVWDGLNRLDGRYAIRYWLDSDLPNAVALVQLLLDGDDTGLNPGIVFVPSLAKLARRVPIPFDLSATIGATVNPATVQRDIADAIQRYVISLAVGATVDYARLLQVVHDVPGVLSLLFSRPTTSQVLAIGYRAVPGAISVNVTTVT